VRGEELVALSVGLADAGPAVAGAPPHPASSQIGNANATSRIDRQNGLGRLELLPLGSA